jgi:sugar/nucleoside kinase (ribokinase family)
LGQDPQADFLLSSLGETGVDLRGVKKTSKDGTPTSIVILNVNGDRSFLYHPGVMAKLAVEDLDMDLLDECSIWHIPGFVKLTALDSAHVFKEGHKRGKICALDTDYDPTGKWYENVAPLLEHLDYFMPSYDEAAAITGIKDPDDNAKFFLDKGIATVVIKLGEEGCLIRRGNERHRLPSYKVKCLDTTGAGDSFVAGFLTGVMKGWSLEESGRLGNACGAMAVMAIGAGGIIKDFDGVMEFMKSNGKAV